MPRTTTALVVATAAALALAGCLGDDEQPSRIEGGTVTVYSSLPRSGVSAMAARATTAGERLALEDAGGRAGGLDVKLVQLDSTEPGERLWDPGQVSANAKRASDDPKAIAYIGELDYGASAVSVPITNDAGILQVSPADGLTSLTRAPIGRPRAGPERYYPTDKRSFLRLVPDDELEAEVLLDQVRQAGARRMAVLYDGDIHGRELGSVLVSLGRRDGPEPVASEEYRGRVEEIPDVVQKLADDGPDVVVYAGVAGPGTGLILAQIRRVLPDVPVYATSGLLARDPSLPIPLAPATVRAVGAIPPTEKLPAEGRRVLARLRRHDSTAVARPEAAYGYEAMRVVLDSIRAGGADRAKVLRQALHTDRRRSPIGAYSVRATGEVDTARFWLYTLQHGRFDFDQMVD